MTTGPKTALVTGASSGLGRDFAGLFARDGHGLIMVGRRKPKLDDVAATLSDEHGVPCYVVVEDLADSIAPQRIFDEAREQGLEVEYLVNSAGFGSSGAFAELDAHRELEMIAVNVASLVHLTRLFLPRMIERGSGRILNIGSTAGFLAGPYMATYYATKAFVNHFSEALWAETEGTNVSITVSCPGPTATEFAAVSGADKSALFRSAPASSADVAQAAYRAMMQGKRMIIHGAKNKLLVQSLRAAPRALTIRMAGRLNRA